MAVSESHSEAIRTASGLAYVCSHLDELRELLGDDGSNPSTPLTRLVGALQAGETPPPRHPGGEQSGEQPAGPYIAGLLNEVHAAVQAAGDALGIYPAGPSRGGGLSGMEVLRIVFRCPLHQCAGRPADKVTGPRPVCTVSPKQLPLIRERI